MEDEKHYYSRRQLANAFILYLQGYNSAQVARGLGITTRTLMHYLHNARYDLGVLNNYQLLAVFVRRGWVELWRDPDDAEQVY